jgi:hypothetical protein
MKTKETATEAQGAQEQKVRPRTISVTKAMIEDLVDAKFKSIVIRLMEQSEANTSGALIWQMAKMLYKQTEIELTPQETE